MERSSSWFVWAVPIGMFGLIGLGILGNAQTANDRKVAEKQFEAEYAEAKKWDHYSPTEETALNKLAKEEPDSQFFPKELLPYVVQDRRFYFQHFGEISKDIKDPRVANELQIDAELTRVIRLKGPHWLQIADRIQRLASKQGAIEPPMDFGPATYVMDWPLDLQNAPREYEVRDETRLSDDVMVVYSRDLSETEIRQTFKSLGFNPFRHSPSVIDYDEMSPADGPVGEEEPPAKWTLWQEYSPEETARLATYARDHRDAAFLPASLSGKLIADRRYFFRYHGSEGKEKFSFYENRLDDPICPYEHRIMRFKGVTAQEAARAYGSMLPAGYKVKSLRPDKNDWYRIDGDAANPRLIEIKAGYQEVELLVSYERRLTATEEASIQKELGFNVIRERPDILYIENLCPSPSDSEE